MTDVSRNTFHDPEYYMRQALRQAQEAASRGEVPVGAVVVWNQRIIARAYNQVEQLKDGTAHAEMIALTQACAAVGDWRLNECSLYVSKEPAPWCRLVNCRLKLVSASRPASGNGALEITAAGTHRAIESDCYPGMR